MKELFAWSKKCNSMEEVADLVGVEEEDLYNAINQGNEILEKQGLHIEVSEKGVIMNNKKH